MSEGLEIYHADGTVALTVTDRISRHVLTASGTLAAQASVSVSVPGITDDGTWAVHTGDGTRYVEINITAGNVTVKNLLYSLSNSWQIIVFRY